MTTSSDAKIRERVQQIETMPAIPAVFLPLLKLLSNSAEEVKVDEVVRLVSYDNTIAGQCLRLAGSPLFGLAQYQGSRHYPRPASRRDHSSHLLPGAGFPRNKVGARPRRILETFAGMRHGVPEIQREVSRPRW
jgi:HDOD domain